MASIRLKFRTQAGRVKIGSLYYEVIHQGTTRRLASGCSLHAEEWDAKKSLVIMQSTDGERLAYLKRVNERIRLCSQWMCEVVSVLERTAPFYTADDVVAAFRIRYGAAGSFVDYARYDVARLRLSGHLGTARNHEATLRSFTAFCGEVKPCFSSLTNSLMSQYEAYLKLRGNSRNTTSFYMRNLRSVYNRAVTDGFAPAKDLFRDVYTGVDKTVKRAISMGEIKRMRSLDLRWSPALEKARDLFLFSFYVRGASFVDLAFMRKKDIVGGVLVYRRHKTGQQLRVKWEHEMQTLVEQYANPTQFLLPIILREDGTEYKQYKNAMMHTNRKLKEVGMLAGISLPLSMYTARHSWATIARDRSIPLSVISRGLGHDNDVNTQIYLATISDDEVDVANKLILQELSRPASGKKGRN